MGRHIYVQPTRKPQLLCINVQLYLAIVQALLLRTLQSLFSRDRYHCMHVVQACASNVRSSWSIRKAVFDLQTQLGYQKLEAQQLHTQRPVGGLLKRERLHMLLESGLFFTTMQPLAGTNVNVSAPPVSPN